MWNEDIAATGTPESVVPITGAFTKFDESFLETLLGPPRLDDNPLMFVEVGEYSVIENARLEVMTPVVPEPSTLLVIAGSVLVALRGRFRKGR
ncbi:MAG: PEP-CTERM sorting domain-containing protein [Fimbriimonadales bacterium]|nr:PEP-CTERM sorting domain-containing protein [Fimbriimonadales bacterium]